MNYGPLTQAIEKLLRVERGSGSEAYRKAWDQIAIAQDKFYKDIKEGRLICEDIDKELEPL